MGCYGQLQTLLFLSSADGDSWFDAEEGEYDEAREAFVVVGGSSVGAAAVSGGSLGGDGSSSSTQFLLDFQIHKVQ